MERLLIGKRNNDMELLVPAHSKSERLVMRLFIISLGLGEIISIGPIKLSHITTILALMVSLIKNNGVIRLTVENRNYSRMLKFCYVWIGYALFQFIWVQNTELYKTFILILAVNIIIIYIMITYIRTREDWLDILESFLLLILISVLVGFWEMKTSIHLVKLTEDDANIQYYLNKPLAFYGNGNDYATVLMFGVFGILLHLFAKRRKKTEILFDLGLLLAVLYQIVVINSRAALYSVFLLFLMLVVLYRATKASRNSTTNRRAINIFLVFLAVASVGLIFLISSPKEIIVRYSGDGNVGSDLGRVQMIVNGVNALISSFGFGVGAGQSILANNINLHFFYLEILVEYGIFVGGYLLVIIFMMSFHVDYGLRSFSEIMMNSLYRSFPIVMILLGVASSGTVRIRATWIIFVLLYTYAYKDQWNGVIDLDVNA